MAHNEPSHLDVHCLQTNVRIYHMSENTWLYPTYCAVYEANGTSTTKIQPSSGNLGLISILSYIYVLTLHIRNPQVYDCSVKNSLIPVITIMRISSRVLNLISKYP